MVTLIGQGLTFGPVARVLGVRADPADEALVRNQARAASVQAGLSRLDQIAADDAAPGAALGALRASLEARPGVTGSCSTGWRPARTRRRPATPEYEAAVQARRAVIDAQREELLRWRDAGHLPDASLRILERELDHEERTLPPHESH